jgi:CBS domain-containing protein
MIDNKIGGLPVVNDDEVIGIVTESDLFEALVCYLDRESNST